MNASRPRARAGSALVPVLLCFVLILLICGALLKIGLAERKYLKAEDTALQAEWLVESGIERAASRLAASSDYTGETWMISPEDLNGPQPGIVTIAVARAEEPGRRRVTVVAEYPRGAEKRSRQHKVVLVDLESAKGGASP